MSNRDKVGRLFLCRSGINSDLMPLMGRQREIGIIIFFLCSLEKTGIKYIWHKIKRYKIGSTTVSSSNRMHSFISNTKLSFNTRTYVNHESCPCRLHEHNAYPPVLHRPQNQKKLWTFSPKYYWNRGLMKILPAQGVVQYSHRSAYVLPTEAPGRHGTQTRTQASPAVA